MNRGLSESHGSALWTLALLCVAAALFVAGQVSLHLINDWWSDELFSLWASDTRIPFGSIFPSRILPDSNPPLYFSLLYGIRLVISDDRLATIALNVIVLAIGVLVVLMASRRSRMVGPAAVAVSAFVLSGPVLGYTPEARSYLVALTIAFCASWYAVLALGEERRTYSLWPFLILGVLATLTHSFAALYCGSLAAALLIMAMVDPSRRHLVAPSLTLGISTTVVFALWLPFVWGAVDNLGWIEFTPQAILGAIWFVRELAIGEWPVVFLLVALLAIGIARPATRPVAILFAITFALFAILPMIASLKQPIIIGRYWMIGAPGLIVLVVVLAAAWYREAWEAGATAIPRIALAGAVIVGVASSISGYLTAYHFTELKMGWKGAPVLGPLLKDCPAASVHVGTFKLLGEMPAASLASFAYLSGASPAAFVDAGARKTPVLPVAQARCPVLAWAENIDQPSRMPDAKLLQLLKIAASPEEVEIHRHDSGAWVLKRGVR